VTKEIILENEEDVMDLLRKVDFDDEFDYVKINKETIIDLAQALDTRKYYPCEDCHYEPAENHNYPEACISCSRFYGDMYTK